MKFDCFLHGKKTNVCIALLESYRDYTFVGHADKPQFKSGGKGRLLFLHLAI